MDLIGFDDPNEAQSGACQQSAGREPLQDLAEKMGQRHCNGLPRGQQTREGEMTMGNLPRRSKRTPPHERTADDEQLAAEDARYLGAIEGGHHAS